MRERAKTAASYGWSARPVTSARLAAEVWQAVKNEPWSLVVSDRINWPRRLWPAHEYHNFLGGSGGQGIGYSAPGAIGAALANRDKGLFSVTIQPDGDLLFAPGRAVDRGAPPDSAADRDVQQPRLRPGGDACGPHGGRACASGRDDPQRHPVLRSRIRTSPRSPRATASGAKDRSRTRTRSRRRSRAPSQVVKSGAPALVDVVCQIR